MLGRGGFIDLLNARAEESQAVNAIMHGRVDDVKYYTAQSLATQKYTSVCTKGLVNYGICEVLITFDNGADAAQVEDVVKVVDLYLSTYAEPLHVLLLQYGAYRKLGMLLGYQSESTTYETYGLK